MKYRLPPQTTNHKGKIRTVGFEIEFAGLDIPEVAKIIKDNFGGRIMRHSNAVYSIRDGKPGDFKVEIDARLLKKIAENRYSEKWNLDQGASFEDSIEEWVNRLAKTIVPVEIVMPPVPLNALDQFEPLIKSLRQQKAEGTDASWIHAFGLHINIEVADYKMDTLLPQFQAFLLLYHWLVEYLDIDLSRRLTPFIAPFPDMYVAQTVQKNYQPDLEEFITDYLRVNSTRNRPLDLVPLFLHLNSKLVKELIETEQSTGRPTWHYRLPNSNIQDKSWNYLDEWETWVLVEQVAGDSEMLSELQQLYTTMKPYDITTSKKAWTKKLDSFLHEQFETDYWCNRS